MIYSCLTSLISKFLEILVSQKLISFLFSLLIAWYFSFHFFFSLFFYLFLPRINFFNSGLLSHECIIFFLGILGMVSCASANDGITTLFERLFLNASITTMIVIFCDVLSAKTSVSSLFSNQAHSMVITQWPPFNQPFVPSVLLGVPLHFCCSIISRSL